MESSRSITNEEVSHNILYRRSSTTDIQSNFPLRIQRLTEGSHRFVVGIFLKLTLRIVLFKHQEKLERTFKAKIKCCILDSFL